MMQLEDFTQHKPADIHSASWHFVQNPCTLAWLIMIHDEGVVEASDHEMQQFASIFDLIRMRLRSATIKASQPREFFVDSSDCQQWMHDCYGYHRGCARVLRRDMLERLLFYSQNPRCFTSLLRARQHDWPHSQQARPSCRAQRKLKHIMATIDTLRSKIVHAASARNTSEVVAARLALCRLAHVMVGLLPVPASQGQTNAHQAFLLQTKPELEEVLLALDRRSIVSSIADSELFHDMAIIARFRGILQQIFARRNSSDLSSDSDDCPVMEPFDDAQLQQQVVWIGFDGKGINSLIAAGMALGSPQLLKQCKAFHLLCRQVEGQAKQKACITPEVSSNDSFLLFQQSANQNDAGSLSNDCSSDSTIVADQNNTQCTENEGPLMPDVVLPEVSVLSDVADSPDLTHTAGLFLPDVYESFGLSRRCAGSTASPRQSPVVLPTLPLDSSTLLADTPPAKRQHLRLPLPQDDDVREASVDGHRCSVQLNRGGGQRGGALKARDMALTGSVEDGGGGFNQAVRKVTFSGGSLQDCLGSDRYGSLQDCLGSNRYGSPGMEELARLYHQGEREEEGAVGAGRGGMWGVCEHRGREREGKEREFHSLLLDEILRRTSGRELAVLLSQMDERCGSSALEMGDKGSSEGVGVREGAKEIGAKAGVHGGDQITQHKHEEVCDKIAQNQQLPCRRTGTVVRGGLMEGSGHGVQQVKSALVVTAGTADGEVISGCMPHSVTTVKGLEAASEVAPIPGGGLSLTAKPGSRKKKTNKIGQQEESARSQLRSRSDTHRPLQSPHEPFAQTRSRSTSGANRTRRNNKITRSRSLSMSPRRGSRSAEGCSPRQNPQSVGRCCHNESEATASIAQRHHDIQRYIEEVAQASGVDAKQGGGMDIEERLVMEAALVSSSEALASRTKAIQITAPSTVDKERARRAAKALKLGTRAEAEEQKRRDQHLQREQRLQLLRNTSQGAARRNERGRSGRARPSALDSSSSQSSGDEGEHVKQLETMRQAALKQAAKRVAETRKKLKAKEALTELEKRKVWHQRDARLRKFAEQQRLRAQLARCTSAAVADAEYTSRHTNARAASEQECQPPFCTNTEADAAVCALNALMDEVYDANELDAPKKTSRQDWEGRVVEEADVMHGSDADEEALAQALAAKISSKRLAYLPHDKGQRGLGAYFDSTHIPQPQAHTSSPHVKFAADLEQEICLDGSREAACLSRIEEISMSSPCANYSDSDVSTSPASAPFQIDEEGWICRTAAS